MRVLFMRAFVPLFAGGALAACGSVPAKTDAGGGEDDGNGSGVADAPVDIPMKACTATVCVNDVLEVCGTDGMVSAFENCELGCFTDNTRCYSFTPSNGLAAQLDMAAGQSDVMLPDNTTINTDNGTITGPNGAIAVATTTVTQSGGPTLRVLIAKTWTLGNVRVTGAAPLALVAAG